MPGAANYGEQVTWRTLTGLFLISLATITDEILLTRIFSVTMWYHFAFGAISLAMFGMTVGSLQVFQRPRLYDRDYAKQKMAQCCLLFSVTSVVSVVAHVMVPFASVPVIAVMWVVFSFCLLSVPFYFSGICVCLALTKFPRYAGSLYASDLIGAGSGCILVIFALKITDATTAVMILALLGSIAALMFALDGGLFRLSKTAGFGSAALLVMALANGILVTRQISPIRVTWAKGEPEPRPLYEKWNSFSRIAVSGDPNVGTTVITEGISSVYDDSRMLRQLHIKIDGDAETTITAFDGNLDDIDYLRYDVKGIVHHIRTGGKVLIIGVGGGRDLLSALSLGQKEVRAVEINQNILQTVNSRFGGFSGYLDRDPRVTFVNDEARSYIARTDERFDVIEASYIDTWAATAAGALTLTENSLYTVDAWKLFLNRLTPDGVLSFSRWYPPGVPAEAYRLTSLAAAALRAVGVTEPRGHILLVRNVRSFHGQDLLGAATILVSRNVFSVGDLASLNLLADRLKFDVVLSPRFSIDPVFAEVAEGNTGSAISRQLNLDISAPTDDRPFFFNLKPLRNLFRAELGERGSYPIQSGELIVILLFSILCLTMFFIVVPVARSVSRETLRGSLPLWLYFVSIGLGFMLIEVSQMQRLIVFLGHPTFALSVVLFTLLVSGGLGSYSTTAVPVPNRWSAARLFILWTALLVFGSLTPRAILAFSSSTTPVRILVASGILFPLGFLMGMAFPLGWKMASSFDTLMPAFWAMNGAASICASILSMFIAINAGISTAFWTGSFCYGTAFLAYCWAAHSIRDRVPQNIPLAEARPTS